MKTRIFSITLLCLIIAAGIFGIFDSRARTAKMWFMSYPSLEVAIGTTTISAQIANTKESRVRGLSNLRSMPENQGLLFVFDDVDEQSMWMKDMKFPLDMIWLDENRYVVSIKENISPKTYPESFSSEEPSAYVLEVNAGFVKKFGVEKGQRVAW